MLYGSEQECKDCKILGKSVVKLDFKDVPSAVREHLSDFGYEIRFETEEGCEKRPAITINRSDNALFFSVYNPNTTTKTLLKFPLGAPVLQGMEAKLTDGYAQYAFSRCEHRECRVFVKQESGVISAHEQAPVSAKYRRRFFVQGLKNATVYYFPEKYCDRFMAAATNGPDSTPRLDEDWEPFYDEIMGWGFKGEGKNGRLSFLMPFEKHLT